MKRLSCAQLHEDEDTFDIEKTDPSNKIFSKTLNVIFLLLVSVFIASVKRETSIHMQRGMQVQGEKDMKK
jgi:hypothetical protein